MMKMYRAVPKDGFDSTKQYYSLSTRRTPSNVPYLVDNIWEWLRPTHFPSRRFSAYASPTPELALENASAVGSNKDAYIVCEVNFNSSEVKLAHIIVKDAKYHQDISKIMRHVITSLGKDFSNMSIKEKTQHSPLFMPGVSKEEMDQYFNSSKEASKLGQELKGLSLFWNEALTSPQNHDGELFFELGNKSNYQLIPLDIKK